MIDFASEPIALVAGILLLASVLVSKLSDHFGIPTLLLFLCIGMISGSEGLGGIHFNSPEIAQAIGSFALLIILFAGGLDTDWKLIRPVLLPGLMLSTLGVFLTTLLLGSFAWYLLGAYKTIELGTGGLQWLPALLLAAIVSSTDAAAVFGVFRTSKVQPPKRVRSLLELESGSNDPMAVLLTTSILGLMTQDTIAPAAIAFDLIKQLVIGIGMGCLLGIVGAWLINHLTLSSQGLYLILVLAIGLVTFGATEVCHGNGFLAVYASALIIGNRLRRNRESIISFQDGLSWLSQIGMFIVLGLFVTPSALPSVALPALAMAFFLVFVARPISVVACLLPFRTDSRDLTYISWAGLRGSVPIVLATFPASYGIAGAEDIFDVVFFIVLTSVLVQGVTLLPCTRWLFQKSSDQ